jgi:hypothetical protein
MHVTLFLAEPRDNCGLNSTIVRDRRALGFSPHPLRNLRPIMPFSFTFRLPVPGLSNPFSNAAPPAQVPPRTSDDSDFSDRRFGDRPGMNKITRRRPSPALILPGAPLSRKRGWEPTFAEPSRSSTTLASTSGYLDTPAKYRAMAGNQPDEYHEVEMMASDTGV